MYRILTKASRTQIIGFHRRVSIWGKMTSSPTCLSQLAPIGQTSNICTKLINAQVVCVTNVDSYSVYAFTNVAGVRDISKIVCHHQVLFAAVKNYSSLKKKQIFLLLQGFTKLQISTYNTCIIYWPSAHTLLENNPYI